MSKEHFNNETTMLCELMDKERWRDAARFTRRLLVKKPNNHWLLATLSHIYYERKDYERALEIAEAALEISPKCPLALGDYAAALFMLDKESEAIAAWKGVISRGIENVAYGECGEGLRHTKEMITNYFFRIGDAYAYLDKKAMAKRYMNKYFEMRNAGVRSIYGLREAKKVMKSLD